MDNNNIDFNKIWKQQTVCPPNIEDLLQKLTELKKSNIRKLIIFNLILILTCAIIIWIAFYFQPQFISTQIGVILIILSMVMLMIFNNKQFSILKNIDATKSNQEYLNELIHLKNKQKHLQTTIMGFYFLFLSVGIGLYMFEYTSRMTPTWEILTYLITLTWIAFNWFYLRPKTIKKQQNKLNNLIQKFEAIKTGEQS